MRLATCPGCGHRTTVLVVEYCDVCLKDVTASFKDVRKQPTGEGPPLLPPRLSAVSS